MDTTGATIGFENLAALAALALAATFTPGPNNALLSASGARFGLRATLPHARGVALGFPLMVFCVALGVGQAFQQSEVLRETLRWGGAALMAWLAWKIASARPAGPAEGPAAPAQDGARPWSFVQAAAFQWVNPKAWVMALGIAAPFVDAASPVRHALAAAAVFAAAGLLSTHAWAAFGAVMGRFLGRGWRLRLFNLAMAALILMGVAALLAEDFSKAA
ncbi:LysE family translocator [Albimonas pacifica]|uniref:Threonine/homoserine/homoserine lactone efflux protein n=1 Tax=Albimonas pacifica TaxID=1114924 RepID=A0A1I3LQN0_9RHOB|nr:LysE family translocator [Albimonas pacifica]SFI86993.1 Threonine/homoserine/homoserine lactone efflux protein [Albimonas pacifica]